MQPQEKVIDCYDKTAGRYAEKYNDELANKHLDRILLASFAAENAATGKLIDLGCGPGQTTKFIADCGLKEIIGVDISPAMVAVAQRQHEQLEFETGDMLHLKYADGSFGTAIAFYSIVHFDLQQLALAFKETRRVLKDGGEFLFSFHIGNSPLHLDEFLEQPVDIDFYFFEREAVSRILEESGFVIVDAIEREPYASFEYPSRRAYIWAKAGVNTSKG